MSVSNSNSNSNSFIGMTREGLASAHSPSLPPHIAMRPVPVTSGLVWSTDCVMLRRGSWRLCAGSDLWTATLWACQHPFRVRDSSDRVSVWSYTDYHCPLIPERFCLCLWHVCVRKLISDAKTFSIPVCVLCASNWQVHISQLQYHTYLCKASGEDLSRCDSIHFGKRS